MIKLRYILSIPLLVVFLGPSIEVAIHGSLVVIMVPYEGDYVVLAAESRTALGIGSPGDYHACKIIELGGNTLFFNTGYGYIRTNQGKPWVANSLARRVYLESKKCNPLGLPIAWSNAAIRWFSQLDWSDVQSIAVHGGLDSGGFVGFESGKPSIQVQIISPTQGQKISAQRKSIGPGTFAHFGAGQLVEEILNKETQRAKDALRPKLTIRSFLVDADVDAEAAAKAVQFAIDHPAGQDKDALGGKIDVAIIRKDRTIQWVNQKPECKTDQNDRCITLPHQSRDDVIRAAREQQECSRRAAKKILAKLRGAGARLKPPLADN
jgi:hypothetical protein